MNRRISIRDGIGYLLVGEEQKLVSVDMNTGKILQRDSEALPGTACSPVVAEDRLFILLDSAHSWGGVKVLVFALMPGRGAVVTRIRIKSPAHTTRHGLPGPS
jgi:hypothetical protein